MAKYFKISGYWKNDKEEFEDYLVTDDEYSPAEFEDEQDDEIFYYGMSEQEIITLIQLSDETLADFVITSYSIA